MKFWLLPISALLLLAVVVKHADAALSSEYYWKKVLPNTPMPKTLHDLLQPDFEEEKSTTMNVGKRAVTVNTKKPGGSGTAVDVGMGGVAVNTGKLTGKGTSVNVGKGGVNVDAGKGKPGDGGTNVNVGRKGVGVSTGKPEGKTSDGRSPIIYNYAKIEDQIHDDDPQVALFFLEKDLRPGIKMNLQFTRTTTGATFLPRQFSEAIPFSSDSLPEIYSKFSVEPSSAEAQAMKNTIEECEEPAQKGEDKYCSTSLESMIDFITSKLGTNVKVMATEAGDSKRRQYIIKPGVKKLSDDTSVVCHAQSYAYAVFYCHETHSTTAYAVPLVGTDGTEAKAVAVCHKDTARWNPRKLVFQVLKVKPGTVPICHFLPEDHIVWVHNQKST